MFILRPLRIEDLAALTAVMASAGPGLTSLPNDESVLRAKLTASWENWCSGGTAHPEAKLLFAVENSETHALCGISGIAARVGEAKPFYNFRLTTEHQQAPNLGIDRRHQVLMICNDCSGWSEIGSLYVAPSCRGSVAGRLASLGRFLYVSRYPDRFSETFFAEMRGVITDDGQSPLWDHLGKHFFSLSFNAADRLSATSDKRFIAELLPRHPIYVDLLAPEAQQVLAAVHPRTVPARTLLEHEGFRYRGLVDIFDGGPVLSCDRDAVRAVRDVRSTKVYAEQSPVIQRSNATTDVHLGDILVSYGENEYFRCIVMTDAVLGAHGLCMTEDQQRALGAGHGDSVFWVHLRTGAMV